MEPTDSGGQMTVLAPRPAPSIQPANALPSREEYSVMVGMANALAKAHGFIPKHFGGDGNKVFAALMYGRDLGFSPTQALQHIIVIDGKATTDAQAAGMLIRRAGHKLHDDTNDQRSTVTITRWDDPGHPFTATFTMEDAKRAGLVKAGSAWVNFPRAMLYARALMECARKGCQDALMGVAYVAEELGADVDQSGHAVAPEYQVGPEPPPLNLMDASPAPERKPDAETGEVPTEQAAPESKAAVDSAAAAPAPESEPEAETPTASPAPAEPRARRGVGPTPKRTNVRQVTPEAAQPEPEASEPSPALEGELTDDSERATAVERVRQIAADLLQIRTRQRNQKAALNGTAPSAMPPDGPNPVADHALNVYLPTLFPGRTLDNLGEADLERLQDGLLRLVAEQSAKEQEG